VVIVSFSCNKDRPGYEQHLAHDSGQGDHRMVGMLEQQSVVHVSKGVRLPYGGHTRQEEDLPDVRVTALVQMRRAMNGGTGIDVTGAQADKGRRWPASSPGKRYLAMLASSAVESNCLLRLDRWFLLIAEITR